MSDMNVLVFIDDQHHADCLGFMGHPLVHTPHIDALASRSTYFNHMYTCSAICGPSRTSFLTGMYLRAHEAVVNNVELRRDLPALPGELRRAGYSAHLFGKSHLPTRLREQFDQHVDMTDYHAWLDQHNLAEGKADDLLTKNFQSFPSQLPEHAHQEPWTADRVMSFLQSPGATEKPFFIWCAFERPHPLLCPPRRFEDMYNPDDIEIDFDAYDRFEAARVANRAMVEDFWKISSVRHDPSIFQKAVARYYGLISMIDEQIGRVLESLEQQNLADNTLVIFTSDHGDFAGRHGQFGKNVPGYDDLLRIPFIWHDPTRTGDGGRCVEGMFQSVDLMPSILERLGLDITPTVQGESLQGAIDGRPGSTRDYIYAETPMVKTIRSRDWKLNFFVDRPHRGQLFRMGAYPDETTNQWDDPTCTHVKARLLAELSAWMGRCEQPMGMCGRSDCYVPTRWYQWLADRPGERV